MSILSVCVSALVSAFLAVMLKKHNAEYSLILTLCACTLLFTMILSEVVFTVSSVQELVKRAGVNSEYIEILLKCLGICFITEFTVDACKDASQNALSNIVLTSGRIATLMAAFPLLEEFLGLALSLCGGGV